MAMSILNSQIRGVKSVFELDSAIKSIDADIATLQENKKKLDFIKRRDETLLAVDWENLLNQILPEDMHFTDHDDISDALRRLAMSRDILKTVRR